MDENKKSKIWLYAVILFTSAFIVLLFTAYSQIKLNKSLDNYKSQVNNKESEKNKYMQNFTSAQEMNAELNEEIEKLENELDLLNKENENLKNELSDIKREQLEKEAAINIFSNAISEYVNGNVVDCAGLLKNIDESKLEEKVKETYKIISAKAYAEAGRVLFNEGFSLYNKAKYNEAAVKLHLSSQYAYEESFSDKCIFYLAYSELKNGNTAIALEYMNRLIEDYPSSKYIYSAKKFIVKYKE